MSKKKIVNLIELGIQGILILSMVLLETVTLFDVSYSSTDWTSSTTTTTTHMTLLEYSLAEMNIMGLIALALMGINAVLCLASVFGNSTDRDGSSHVVIPMINLFFGIWIFSVSASMYYDVLMVDEAHKVLGIAGLVVVVILAIVKRSSRIAPVTAPHSTTIIQEVSTADELKKYKELLDSGVITQAEYDEKKKQLLGL